MSTLFISDLHLCGERPEITTLFLNFLRHRARQCKTLYILGDLFEVWLGDDALLPEHHDILTVLRHVQEEGTAVRVMHGNRDFLLGSGFEEMSGCRLIPDPTVIKLDGKPALLMHGDTLCTDDIEYQQFRARVRNPYFQHEFLSRPVRERAAIAARYRGESQERSSRKSAAIMDVNPGSVEKAMRKHQVKLLIHGHTHRPAIHNLELDGRKARRIVLGDWYRQGSVLCCDGGRVHLKTIPLTPGLPESAG